MLSQTYSTENVVTCAETIFFLCSLALHEFPNDIFTNEDRRQGAVVLHVLCVSTPLCLCPEGPQARPRGVG